MLGNEVLEGHEKASNFPKSRKNKNLLKEFPVLAFSLSKSTVFLFFFIFAIFGIFFTQSLHIAGKILATFGSPSWPFFFLRLEFC